MGLDKEKRVEHIRIFIMESIMTIMVAYEICNKYINSNY